MIENHLLLLIVSLINWTFNQSQWFSVLFNHRFYANDDPKFISISFQFIYIFLIGLSSLTPNYNSNGPDETVCV